MKTKIPTIWFALFCAGLHAENASSVSFKSNILSQYVDTDGQVYYNKPVVQSEITIPLSHGFYIDVWHSAGINMRTGDGNELVTSIGWSKEGKVSVDMGVSYYDFPTFFHGPKNDLYVAYGKVSKIFRYNYGSLEPALELTHYKSGKGSDGGGSRAKISVEYSRKLYSDLTYIASIVHDNGTFDSASAWVTSHELSFGWKIGKVTIKLPSIAAYVPLSTHSGRKISMVCGFGISF